MRHEHTDTRKIGIAKLPPQALIEPGHTIVRIRRTLPVRDAIEEMAVVGALPPHALHLLAARLEVAKVLFAQARLFPHLDLLAREGGWAVISAMAAVRGGGGGGAACGESAEQAFGRLACAAVGACEDLERVVGFEEGF